MFRHHIRRGVILGIALLGLFAVNLPASRRGALPRYHPAGAPFQVGEELQYRISWGVIPAGKGTLTIPDRTGTDGAYHIVTTARSNSFVDTFYKVRNRIETYLDLDRSYSLGYKKIQHEGAHNRDVDLVFDHKNREVTLIKNGKVKNSLTIPDPIHDPLSAIYYLRTIRDWDREPVLNVTDGNKNYQVRIQILGKETVKTPLGFFNTIKIEPTIEDMEIIFDKKRDGKLYIWLTDDGKRIPVKMRSELAFGSIQVLLQEVKLAAQAD